MFPKRTTFIIGAGASFELGFPLGSTLLERIASSCDFQVQARQLSSGDDEIWQVIQQLQREDPAGPSLEDYQQAAWRIRDAAAHSGSIDNVIFQNDHDPLVPLVAKLAIAKHIISAERSSTLLLSNNPDEMDHGPTAGTWLRIFGRMLCNGYQRSTAEKIFESVSFVIFNYDRTVEQYLPFVLAGSFGFPLEEARAIVRRVDFHHPYGSLGLLPWQGGQITYGSENASLPTIASGIQTFTEQVTDHQSLGRLRTSVSGAERLIFLGFGYHQQNLDLLLSNLKSVTRIWGTSHNLPGPAHSAVQERLRPFYQEPSPRPAILDSNTCAHFLGRYEMELTN